MGIEGWDFACSVPLGEFYNNSRPPSLSESFRTISTHLFPHYQSITRLRDRELEEKFCHLRPNE